MLHPSRRTRGTFAASAVAVLAIGFSLVAGTAHARATSTALTFSHQQLTLSQPGSYALLAGSFFAGTTSSRLDLAVTQAGLSASPLLLYRNQGDGTFGSPAQTTAHTGITPLAAVQTDWMSAADIPIFATANVNASDVTLLSASTAPTGNDPVNYDQVATVVLPEAPWGLAKFVTATGEKMLAVADSRFGVQLIKQNGSGGFELIAPIAVNDHYTKAVATGDLNGDTYSDLAVAFDDIGVYGSATKIYVYWGNAAGGFDTTPSQIDTRWDGTHGVDPDSIQIASFGAQKSILLAFASPGSDRIEKIDYQGPNHEFATPTTYNLTTTNQLTWVAPPADVNADGYLDLIVTAGQTMQVLLGQTSGFTDALSFPLGGDAVGPAVVASLSGVIPNIDIAAPSNNGPTVFLNTSDLSQAGDTNVTGSVGNTLRVVVPPSLLFPPLLPGETSPPVPFVISVVSTGGAYSIALSRTEWIPAADIPIRVSLDSVTAPDDQISGLSSGTLMPAGQTIPIGHTNGFHSQHEWRTSFRAGPVGDALAGDRGFTLTTTIIVGA